MRSLTTEDEDPDDEGVEVRLGRAGLFAEGIGMDEVEGGNEASSASSCLRRSAGSGAEAPARPEGSVEAAVWRRRAAPPATIPGP